MRMMVACLSRTAGMALGLLVILFSLPCIAQFVGPSSANLTTIVSPVDSRITVSFKVPKGVCTTAFETQQQYTGWVNVPSNGNYETNLFFWFVAAREPTSMLTIWLNGGPGTSSLFGMFAEMGPCEVIEQGADRLGTAARQWGWDRASNMLFIDQPNQVGFAYDVPTNGTMDFVTYNVTTPPNLIAGADPLLLNGTFSSGNGKTTPNTTEVAAMAVYHMMQGFLTTFPQYNPPNNSSLGVNLFAESYGGKYGPVFLDVWETENEKRRNGSAPASTVDIHLASLGIVNGCVDLLVEGPYYADFMVNNTYGVQAIPPRQAALAKANFYQPGGCRDAIVNCRMQQQANDPYSQGSEPDVNAPCGYASQMCNDQLLLPYQDSRRSPYDLAAMVPALWPPRFFTEYLNSAAVQHAVGTPVNYTDWALAARYNFIATGDQARGPVLPRLARLLKAGIRIGFVFGDRDFICNWLGGEAVSLALAAEAGAPYDAAFPAAGYAPIIVNDSYIGGAVRQFANLSFSRVYQSGHFVPAAQPETAFQIFARIILGTSVSTGAPADLRLYNTSGPANATKTAALPDGPAPTCFVRNAGDLCSPDQIESIRDGKGVIVNGAWYPALTDWPGATSATAASETAGKSSTPALTGLFTATATPSSGHSTIRDVRSMSSLVGAGTFVACLISII